MSGPRGQIKRETFRGEFLVALKIYAAFFLGGVVFATPVLLLAKAFGLRVYSASIGQTLTIFAFVWRGTRLKIKLLPLGSNVNFDEEKTDWPEGEEPDDGDLDEELDEDLDEELDEEAEEARKAEERDLLKNDFWRASLGRKLAVRARLRGACGLVGRSEGSSCFSLARLQLPPASSRAWPGVLPLVLRKPFFR